MNLGEKECIPQGICDNRGKVTSQYKKYFSTIPVALRGISDRLVTNFSGFSFSIDPFFALKIKVISIRSKGFT